MARSVGDTLPETANLAVVRYCHECERDARTCPHKGNRYEVALHGGHQTSRVLQTIADGRMVRWDEHGDYLKMPYEVALRAFGSQTRSVEVYDPEPPFEPEPTWWVAETPRRLSSVETWDDGRMLWTAFPRHALTRYRETERNGKTRMAKVRAKLGDRPCYCHQGQRCADFGERRERWAREEAPGRIDPEDARWYGRSGLHPEWTTPLVEAAVATSSSA